VYIPYKLKEIHHLKILNLEENLINNLNEKNQVHKQNHEKDLIKNMELK
jgi:hypothetical protein